MAERITDLPACATRLDHATLTLWRGWAGGVRPTLTTTATVLASLTAATLLAVAVHGAVVGGWDPVTLQRPSGPPLSFAPDGLWLVDLLATAETGAWSSATVSRIHPSLASGRAQALAVTLRLAVTVLALLPVPWALRRVRRPVVVAAATAVLVTALVDARTARLGGIAHPEVGATVEIGVLVAVLALPAGLVALGLRERRRR